MASPQQHQLHHQQHQQHQQLQQQQVQHQRSNSLPMSSLHVNATSTSTSSTSTSTSPSPLPSPHSSSDVGVLKRSSSVQLFHNDEPFVFAQSLTSVCLDPTAPPLNEWKPDELVVPPVSSSIPFIHMKSFQSYLNKVSQAYRIFKDNEQQDLIPTNKKTSDEIIDLNHIPEFFFHKQLSKQQILDYANSDPSPIMFQKLEHYSAIVEENIVGHVREQSQSFFNAMSDLKQFRTELNRLYHELIHARETLSKVDNEVVKSSLNISRLFLQKNRAVEALSILSMTQDVKQAQPTLQLLLSKGDYGGALDLIHTTQQSLADGLAPISSLKNIGPQLAEMIKLIEKMLESDFIKITLNDDLLLQSIHDDGDLDASTATSSSKSTSMVSPGISSPQLDITQNLNETLLPVVETLLRIGRIGEVLEAFRESSVDSVKSLFKTVVSSIVFERDHEKKIASNQSTDTPVNFTWDECKAHLIKLSPTDSLPLFKAVNAEFKKKMIITKNIIDLVIAEVDRFEDHLQQQQQQGQGDGSSGNTSPTHRSGVMPNHNKQETIKVICSNILASINEAMQERLSYLIKIRSDANSRLALPDFVTLTKHINTFIKFSEQILVKKKASTLRSNQLTQSKIFLDTLHKNKVASLTMLMENEEWIPAQVVGEFQRIINQLVHRAMLCTSPNMPPMESSAHDEIPQPVTLEDPSTSSQQHVNLSVKEYISISDEKFKVGNTVLMMLKFINDYLHCIDLLPALVIDSIPKFVELLHTFNGMTYQLVLGAGARQTMKLKTITSKHLGLASQCLSFQIKMIPHLKTILQHLLPSKNQFPLLNGFDKIIQDYSSHRSEIFEKFVVILKERSLSQMKALSTLDLKNDTMPIPSPPIASLVKDFTTLHKLLNALLPPDQMFKVFTNIYYMLNNILVESIQRLELNSVAARRRIHNDILHFMESLRTLPNVGNPGTAVEDFLNKHYAIR
ncbi:hypothetical protein SAMD00019534_104530 [Acytostelium subglobosum LB1]|uniref:hypothetical protein n=1 Tax=Acytostelium subglobosum LB1 TaxID=1410327 RepID=UPI000644F797|nr:hypothetical protein SAMD00019534_104530 [Acytostelium subglobosum LB1]GAM27278.1 hypothetical protein SAMD00019534_104530 [Acytostelium subglobosum LB1]|eukprot:XP_012749745.1 hypothetical protein SAMD00019534_104530 [Acytostelium subglobosum LB1]